MDTNAKTYGLFIEPSALRVDGRLRNYRWAIARLASNIWWHLNLSNEQDADWSGCPVTAIKAVTSDTESVTTDMKIPFHIEIKRRALLEDLPTFDDVLDLCIELFTQMFRVHEPQLCKFDYGDGNIDYCEHSYWKLIVKAVNGETFWEAFLETDEHHYEAEETMKKFPFHKFVDTVVEL